MTTDRQVDTSKPAPSSPVISPTTQTSGQRSTSGDRRSVRKSGGGRSGRFWVVLVSGLIIALGLTAIVLFFGHVRGREFAPSHFETRSFSFYEIPLLKLQITPIRRTSEQSNLQAYLATTALLTRPTGQAKIWHLIEVDRPPGGAWSADAKLLTDFLDVGDRQRWAQNKSLWHQWSVDHPQHAKALWPRVQKLADRELYVLIPELFRIAAQATYKERLLVAAVSATGGKPKATAGTQSPTGRSSGAGSIGSAVQVMQQKMDNYLLVSYLALIEEMNAAGRLTVAESLRQEATKDFPDEPRLRSSP